MKFLLAIFQLLQFLLHANAYAEVGVLAEVLAVHLAVLILLGLPLLEWILLFVVQVSVFVVFQVGVLLFEGKTPHLIAWSGAAAGTSEIDTPVTIVEILESIIKLVQVH